MEVYKTHFRVGIIYHDFFLTVSQQVIVSELRINIFFKNQQIDTYEYLIQFGTNYIKQMTNRNTMQEINLLGGHTFT